jgi:hypothetical protein
MRTAVDVPETERPADVAGRWLDVSVVLVYVAIAIWVLGPLWRDPGHLRPDANAADPDFFAWMLRHAVRIFTAGEHPFRTPTLNAPFGVNVLANTGLLGLTVPLAPLTAIVGPQVSFVALLTIGLAGTAAAWYWVLSRHVVASRVAAAIGAGFAGFAPGLVNHANGHPNLVAQFLIPFIVWRALTLRSVRDGVILGLLVTWQAFINEELLFLTGLALVVFVLAHGFPRERIRAFAIGLGTAAGTAGVLLAYPLWYQFAGPQSYHGLPDFVLTYGADVASYAAFPKLSLAHGAGTLSPIPEENTFFGWPLLVLLLAAVGWLWRRPAVRGLAVVAVLFALLSLGTAANWYGRPFWSGAPWHYLNHLPLFDSVLPVRLGLVVVPVFAVLLALALDEALRWRYGAAALVAVAVALAPLVPVPLPTAPTATVPAFFASGDWRRYLPPGRSVVSADTTVWFGGVTAMHWDDATGQAYPMVGGYFLGPDPTGKGQYGAPGRPTSDLLGNIAYNGGVPPIGDNDRAQAQADVSYWNAGLVVLAPDAPHHDELRATLEALFGAGRSVDDVMVWTVG